ncbi:MAG TPA: sulfotransferase [Solirubrobacteraceae bacterium]|jgi:DNA-binding NarL/FixJ family response regulator|nr:sulfotransferase [Solirubrobacteraceae bacterium]
MPASPAVPVTNKRLPDFFVVGHPKSGTSALYQMLREYPRIHMPRKEPSYFVPEFRSARSTRYSRGIDEYLSLFDGARPEQLIGEATTSYLFSEMAAERIAQVQPDARIIAILREPASFLRSLHLQFIRSNVETEQELRTAIELEQPRREGKRLPRNSTRPQALIYSDHVRYVEQLKRYHAAFAREQVLVLIYEDFRADNERTLRQVLRFLELDDAAPGELVEANHATGVRSARVHEIVRSLYLGRSPATRPVKAAIKALTPRRLRHEALATVNRAQRSSPPPADAELMLELRRRFKREVESLSDYLDRDLVAFWGYDDLD